MLSLRLRMDDDGIMIFNSEHKALLTVWSGDVKKGIEIDKDIKNFPSLQLAVWNVTRFMSEMCS